ncbi:tetratricopeptide repeat-containing sensor histidine kinase [Flavobacterium sp. SM2513]|uniref:tetratricopeptide repeat-containing sensor histidine kinase n=1 Tax=Flavobacterium sp. SM2513 TaxID=3424766 RepID=UPI003D7F1B18
MQIQSSVLKYFLLFLILYLGGNETLNAQNKTIDSLLLALSKEKSEVNKIPTLRLLSNAYTAVDLDKKYTYAKKLRDIAEKFQIDSIIPLAYCDMGMKFAIKTEYDSAMYYFNKSLTIALNKKIFKAQGRAYVSIGYTYDRLDDPKKAIENYKLALNVWKKIDNKNGLNQTYINLGSLYYDLKEYRVADQYFSQVLKSYEEMGDEAGIAYGNFILGNSSRKLDKDDKAREYYNKSLALREKLGDINGIGLANLGLGELYLKQEKYEMAEKALQIALEKNQITKNKYQETVVLGTLASSYLGLKRYNQARKAAQESYDNAVAMKSKGLATIALQILIEIEQKAGNYRKAFEFQSRYIDAKDSLNIQKLKNEVILSDFQRVRTDNTTLEKHNEVISTKNLTYKKAIYIITSLLGLVLVLLVLYLRKIKQRSKINKVLTKQTFEMIEMNQTLESVNEELRVQNDVTTNQNAELERINAVKNKFFSIVSHDLRSPIATLKMLFNSYTSGHLTREEMDMLLGKLEENIFTTADFLDNLLEWSKSQLEGMVVNPESFPILNLIERNLAILTPQTIEKQLTVENTITNDVSVLADKNMINVVFRNILSNSIKFCREGDSITVSCIVNDNSVLIVIKDTGIGIHPDEQKKIFQLEHTISQGTSGEKGHHIGLVLCKDMIEQNNGSIWFESVLGEGTTFYIEIPLAVS